MRKTKKSFIGPAALELHGALLAADRGDKTPLSSDLLEHAFEQAAIDLPIDLVRGMMLDRGYKRAYLGLRNYIKKED